MNFAEEKQEFSWIKKISKNFIDNNEFEKLEKSSVKLSFKKGEIILKQGNLPSHIVFLEQGIVKFNYENENCKNLILTIVSAPKILGGANIFYKDTNLFSFIAVEDCRVTLVDAKVFECILSCNSNFAMLMLQSVSEMFKTSVMNFISMANKQKEGRIADVVLYLASDVYHANSFRLSLTRKEIAEFAACSPENVIMTLSRWQNEEIINIYCKILEIKDIERLRHISKIG